MSDYEGARNLYCKRCHTSFCDADGGCDCPEPVICEECEEDVSEDVEESVTYCWEHLYDEDDLRAVCKALTAKIKGLCAIIHSKNLILDEVSATLETMRGDNG